MGTFSNVASELVDGMLQFTKKATKAAILTIDPDDSRVQVDKFFGFGVPENATVASGVLTVTKSHAIVLPESSTTDTVDSIVMTGVQAGDVLLLVSVAANTITFDDANINLAAATRAVAPGGCLGLYYDGAQWTEMFFLAASDNV